MTLEPNSEIRSLRFGPFIIDAAAPLAGALAGHVPTEAALKARARFARASGENARAVSLLEEAKALAGAQWDAENEALLAEYRLP